MMPSGQGCQDRKATCCRWRSRTCGWIGKARRRKVVRGGP